MAILKVVAAAVLAFAAHSALGATPEPADHAAEVDLKTAYAFNFIVLSTWPEDTPPVLRVCVAGARPGPNAFQALSGKRARERTLSVVSLSDPERARDCSVLYIPPSESPRLAAWLTAVANSATLTISDGAEERGAIVNLRVVGRQVVFDLDTRAATNARLQLSSQLIKLAATRR